MAQAEEHRIKEYLLGQLNEAEEEQVELRLLTEPDFAEQYDIVVNELTDDYIAGKFAGKELKQVEEHFFKSGARRNKLKFALALKARKSDLSADKGRDKSWFKPYLAIAATVVLLAGGGFFVWRVWSNNSEVNKGLAALQSAFRDERPLEARISKFDYAPYVPTRGAGPERVDQDELRRAELTLLDAVKRNPTPAVHHGLGKVYLAKKDFDKAIQEFDEALKGDPKNAQIYSDLGAVWLEKGKIDLERGKAEPASSTAGKGMEELGRSLENLNKALELNPDLLEALFNRGLCRQYLLIPQQAEDDWREYVKKDSASPWAEEARRNLKILEEQKTRKTQTSDHLLNDFLAACESEDDDAAWAALSLSRGRAGNLIVQALLDDYLRLFAIRETNQANGKLVHVVYAGRLEQERVGDAYTADLARFYSSLKPDGHQALMKARALMHSANELYNRGEFDDALVLFHQAKSSFATSGDEYEVLFAESWINYCQVRNLTAEDGSRPFERLVRTFEEHRYLSLAGQALQALADAKFNLNELSKALEYSSRALKISEEIADAVTAVRCQIQLLSTHLALGDYRRSLDYFIQAMRSSEGLPQDPKLTWPAYNDAGLDFQFLGLPSTALGFEEEALRMASTANVALLRSRSLERLGLLYSEKKDYEQAIQNGERAFAEAKTISGERAKNNILAHSMLLLGQFNAGAGKAHEALDYFDKSLDLYRKLNSPLYLYEAHKGKLLADIELGDNAVTRAELSTAIDLFEQNRQKIVEESNRNKFFDAGQKIYDIAVDFTWKSDAVQAFNYAEQSRARALFEMMRAGFSVANNGDSPEIELRAETKPLSRTEIQARLPEQAQLLEYAVLDNRLVMWVVKNSSIESEVTLISADDLERLTRSYVQSLTQPSQTDRAEVLQTGKELYANLIEPVEKYLDRSRVLCVIPDKSLNYLPFEALVSSSSGRYLIEDYKIERAPSATIFIASCEQARTRERAASERLLSVGNPSFNRDEFSSLPDLPGAVREVEQIAAFYRPEIHLVGEAATAGRVKQALVDADVIHLATHAVADERSPLLSKLLMATEAATNSAKNEGSGVLRAAEIYGIRLPRARVVVLSACQTGIERTYRGEGAISLARPFLVAGVPIVIASLWAVDSDVTAELMISFHKHRKQDPDRISSVEALRRAQLDMIHKPQPNSREAFGWAAFTAIGGYADF
jgi:CHAT domain-containing protein